MKIKEDTYAGLLSVAKDAVVFAGAYLSGPGRAVVSVNSAEGKDIKLSADVESERIIIDRLEKNSDFNIISEECGNRRGSDGSHTWMVDPLDGSMNYMRGIPICCVSVGLWKGDVPVLGAVYDFNRSELFSGIVGTGAWLNGESIRSSAVPAKGSAVLCTGFPVKMDYSKGNLDRYVKNVQEFKKVRMIGSAATSVVYVACGRADAYIEDDIMIWDIAGGLAVAASSGCKFSVSKGNKENSVRVILSNGKIGWERSEAE